LRQMASQAHTPHAAAVNPAAAVLLERLEPADLDLPAGRARLRLETTDEGAADVLLDSRGGRLDDVAGRPDAVLTADSATWQQIAHDLPSGMAAFATGRLMIRQNLHLGVNFLAATSGSRDPARLRFQTIQTKRGAMSTMTAGSGRPLVLLHGLGGTKASFLPTVAALAPAGRRVIAVDLPGFGDSDKPVGARYDAPFFSKSVKALLDAMGIGHADVLGHSMGGRVALELTMHAPERFGRAVFMTPSLPWLRERRWAAWLRFVRPELGLIQPTPRPLVEEFVKRMIPGGHSRYAAAGIDEFLRSYTTPRGRAAFYAAARQIYLEQPERFWSRLRELELPSLFIWGASDGLVPAAFARHVREAVPAAQHVLLRCGHVPQIERPRELHAALSRFLRP
jgi:pimeloyl-ACP methyl ester carboxylesterase